MFVVCVRFRAQACLCCCFCFWETQTDDTRGSDDDRKIQNQSLAPSQRGQRASTLRLYKSLEVRPRAIYIYIYIYIYISQYMYNIYIYTYTYVSLVLCCFVVVCFVCVVNVPCVCGLQLSVLVALCFFRLAKVVLQLYVRCVLCINKQINK